MTELYYRPLREFAVTKGLVGGPFGSKLVKRDYTDFGVPVIRGKNLASDSYFADDEFVFVSEEKANQDLARNLAAPGDVVFTQRGTLGQVGIVPDGKYPRYVVSQSQMRLRVDPQRATAKFIYYCFRNPKMIDLINSRAITTGVPHINLRILGELPVPEFPLRRQNSIVEVLSALDDKIAVNERITVTYGELLAARFSIIDVGNEPTSENEALAGEFVEFNPRYLKPKTDTAPYVDMAALPTTTARIKSWRHRPPVSGARFCNGDTLLARITPCLENGKTGYVDFLEENEIGVGSTEFIVMRSRDGVPQHFSYLLARSKRFRDYAISNMVGSSGRQRCPVDVLPNFTFNRPSSTAMKHLDVEASAAFKHMRSLDQESATLAALRDTLLPKLISGEIRVKDAEDQVSDAV